VHFVVIDCADQDSSACDATDDSDPKKNDPCNVLRPRLVLERRPEIDAEKLCDFRGIYASY